MKRKIAALILFCSLPWMPIGAEEADNGQKIKKGYFKFSVEELMHVDVKTVSRKEKELSDTPAAAYVLTAEDIHRSGATSIPELLRMVPGVQVAHHSANVWGVSVRGFNSWLDNKLLVLIDGRSIYNQQFSGVEWDRHNLLLEDIERIEIIRGPGGTLWGGNAVNGIINIITKNAKKTQGTLMTARGGTVENGASLRYGAQIGEKISYRVYANFFDRDNFDTPPGGTKANDQWKVAQGGFRLDWDVSDQDVLTISGDVYDGKLHNAWSDVDLTRNPFSQDTPSRDSMNGRNLLASWTRNLAEDSNWKLQFYYDLEERHTLIQARKNEVFDIDFQHYFQWGSRQEITWGMGYRSTKNNIFNGSFTLGFEPDDLDQDLLSAFVQDEITLLPERLFLTFGSKLEDNPFTDIEFQPSARLLWRPRKGHSIWGGVTRAVRTPAQNDTGLQLNFAAFPTGDGNIVLSAQGNPDTESEVLIAYELGYRVQPWEVVSLDLAGFYNDYDDIVSQEAGDGSFTLSPIPHVNVPRINNNALSGKSYGLEVALNWDIQDWWRLKTGLAWLEIDLQQDASLVDPTDNEARLEGNDPDFQGNISSLMTLPYNLQFDIMIYYVDELEFQNIDSYTRIDLRLSWQPIDSLEVSIIGQNVTDPQHAEFDDLFARVAPTEVPRTAYAKVGWKF